MTLEASPETLPQAWRRTGRPRELIKSTLIDHWRKDEKQRWAQELLMHSEATNYFFGLRIGSMEGPIAYDVFAPHLPDCHVRFSKELTEKAAKGLCT